jgi:hypothetical protein
MCYYLWYVFIATSSHEADNLTVSYAVGIPYPNATSIELSERQKYLRALPRVTPLLPGQPDAGDVLCE